MTDRSGVDRALVGADARMFVGRGDAEGHEAAQAPAVTVLVLLMAVAGVTAAKRHSGHARGWSTAAAVLGVSHAGISALWLVGSDWLLSTIGGPLERWGRDGGIEVRFALSAVVLVKLAVVAATWAAVTRGRRPERALAWTAGLVLTLYGAVLTVAGIAIVAFGAADLSRSDDPRAVRWHAYFWDPWFLLWGCCVLAALAASRPDATARR